MSRNRWVVLAVAALGAAAPFLITSRYLFHLLIMTVIWGILATGLNLVMGYAGLLSVAHGALFGIGAYTSALLVLKLHWNFWPTLVAAAAAAALAGVVIGVLTLRLKSHYFAISTLSFGIVVSLVIEKWGRLTEGPRGLTSIPAPSPIDLGLLTIRFQSNTAKYYLALAVLALCLAVVYRLVRSPVGRALEALCQNEAVAASLAIDGAYYKLVAFAVSAAMAGVAGALYSVYITYLNPADAGFWNGFYALLYVVIGGMGTLWGPVAGCLVLVTIPEFLRMFQEFRLFLLGVLLMVMVTFLPRGIVGEVTAAWRRHARRTARQT